MGLVGRGGAAQQPFILSSRPAYGVDVQIHERTWSHALRLGQRRQVGHADIQYEDAARAEHAKRGGPCATPIIEREQMRYRTAGNDDRVEGVARAWPVAHIAFHERDSLPHL